MSKYIYKDGAIHHDHHKEMTVNVSGKTDVAALMKAFMADDIEDVEEVKDETNSNTTKADHSPEDIIQYVMKLHPLYVSEKWKEYYRSLWEGVLQLPEVESVIYDKGRQKNTTFNRNLVGNILCLMIDKKVLSGNATQITIALEGKEGASIRAQLGMLPTDKKLKESMVEIIETFLP